MNFSFSTQAFEGLFIRFVEPRLILARASVNMRLSSHPSFAATLNPRVVLQTHCRFNQFYSYYIHSY